MGSLTAMSTSVYLRVAQMPKLKIIPRARPAPQVTAVKAGPAQLANRPTVI